MMSKKITSTQLAESLYKNIGPDIFPNINENQFKLLGMTLHKNTDEILVRPKPLIMASNLRNKNILIVFLETLLNLTHTFRKSPP